MTDKPTQRRQEDGTLLIINSVLVEMQHVQRTMLDVQVKHGSILEKQNTILEGMSGMIKNYRDVTGTVEMAKSGGKFLLWIAAIGAAWSYIKSKYGG